MRTLATLVLASFLAGCAGVNWEQYDYEKAEKACGDQVGDPMGCERGKPEPLCPADAKTCEDLEQTEHVG